MNKLQFSIVLVFLVSSVNSYSQENVTVTNSNGWYMYSGNHKFSDQWSLHTLIHVRRSNIITDWQQSLNRVGLNYHLNKNAVAAMGYDYVHTFPYGESPISEEVLTHASWETMTIKHEIGKMKFSHRYRLEQLWNTKLSEINYTFSNRFRYMISGAIPLFNKVFISYFDEIFISFGKNISYNNFNQNRIYAGIAYKINHGDVQIGYMNQLIKKGIGLTYENNNTLMIGVNYSLDFRKE